MWLEQWGEESIPGSWNDWQATIRSWGMALAFWTFGTVGLLARSSLVKTNWAPHMWHEFGHCGDVKGCPWPWECGITVFSIHSPSILPVFFFSLSLERPCHQHPSLSILLTTVKITQLQSFMWRIPCVCTFHSWDTLGFSDKDSFYCLEKRKLG